MTELGLRLQKARLALQLSQEYVAQQMGLGRSSISQIELGNRKVSCDELSKFSELYCIPAEELLSGRPVSLPSQVFARAFNELDTNDQQEILNLMEFKRMMKERKNYVEHNGSGSN